MRCFLFALLLASASARSVGEASVAPRSGSLERPSLRPRHVKNLQRLRGGDVAAPVVSDPGILGAIVKQVSYEIAHCNDSPAKFYGFVGACCNWFLGLSAVVDAMNKGPEVIALPMTFAMLAYSCLFGRWAGFDVTPKNYILAFSHLFNIFAQCNQLRRAIEYKLETQPGAKAELSALGTKAGGVLFLVAAYTLACPTLRAMMPEGSYLASAGGPFTIHPWPPVTKLFLSMASLTDLFKPTDKISLLQYAALTLTGAIFSKYGLCVTPINYPLTAVNILLLLSSGWHLGRKVKADFL